MGKSIFLMACSLVISVSVAAKVAPDAEASNAIILSAIFFVGGIVCAAIEDK